MKKFVLASLFVVAAAAMQPALAAKAAKPKLCGKGTKICACGKLPGAMWQCCNAKAKCDLAGCRTASITERRSGACRSGRISYVTRFSGIQSLGTKRGRTSPA